MARTATPSPTSEHFIPHIQGLRAIAVLLVVVYHFWPARLTGGYIGVDIFFVISGFLISGQLVRELRARGTIGLLEFWAKRIRRLVPASLFVLIVSIALTVWVLPLAFAPASLWDITASALYWQNWHLAASSVDYLASAGHTISEHYWSLSLEEQFYVVWPLLLLLVFSVSARLAVRHRWILVTLCVSAIGVVSLLASMWFTAVNPAQAYFVLFTRVWEFAAGALLVLVPQLRPAAGWKSNVIGMLGLALITGSAMALTSESPFPGWLAAFPVLGTVALLSIQPGGGRFGVARALSLRPMRFLGDISYSLYLWHWPLIIAAPFIAGWGLSAVNRVALFVGAFVLAWLTKRFVEDPMRRLPYLVKRTPRFTFGWMLVALALVGALIAGAFAVVTPKYAAAAQELSSITANPPACFGAEVITGCSNPSLDEVIVPSPGFGSADRPGNEDCFVQLNEAALVQCSFGSMEPGAPRIALIGDSHAYQYIDALIRQSELNGWNLTTYLKGACPWTVADSADSNPAFVASCRTWRTNLASELASIQPYDAIVTAGLASGLVEASGSNEQAAADVAAAWSSQSQGSPVIAIVDNPSSESDPNNCLRFASASSCSFDRTGSLVVPDPLLAAARIVPRASAVDFTSVFCDNSHCRVVISGANVYRDQDHLTTTFANTMGPAIADSVRAALSLRG